MFVFFLLIYNVGEVSFLECGVIFKEGVNKGGCYQKLERKVKVGYYVQLSVGIQRVKR